MLIKRDCMLLLSNYNLITRQFRTLFIKTGYSAIRSLPSYERERSVNVVLTVKGMCEVV